MSPRTAPLRRFVETSFAINILTSYHQIKTSIGPWVGLISRRGSIAQPSHATFQLRGGLSLSLQPFVFWLASNFLLICHHKSIDVSSGFDTLRFQRLEGHDSLRNARQYLMKLSYTIHNAIPLLRCAFLISEQGSGTCPQQQYLLEKIIPETYYQSLNKLKMRIIYV